MDAAKNNNWPEGNGGEAALTGKAVAMPRDVTEWVGSLTLVRMTLEAIEHVKPEFKQTQFKTAFGSYQAPMLLTLLVCAYAKGMTGSRDIELAIPNDRALKYICAGNRPDWNVLRLFRRQHKTLVQNCLAALLGKVWENQYPAETMGRPVEPGNYTNSSLDRWMIPPRPDFQAEAAKRVRLAILADTLLSDE